MDAVGRLSPIGELVSRFNVHFIVVKRMLNGLISSIDALQSGKFCIGSDAESLQLPINLRPALRVGGILAAVMIASIAPLHKSAHVLRQF